jgi:glucose uptake protein
LGSLGDELSFWDNLQISGKRQMGLALAAGFVFNLGNMLLVAAVSIGGMATSFGIAGSIALMVSLIWTRLDASPALSLAMIGVAVALFLISAGIAAMAHLMTGKAKPAEPAAAAPAPEAPRRRKLSQQNDSPMFSLPLKTILLAIAAGIFLGSVQVLVNMASEAEQLGLGPYPVVFLMGIGILISTVMYNLYFMNLPVDGVPVQFFRYLQGSFGQHFMGILGGFLWSAGTLALMVALAAPRTASLAASMGQWFVHGGILLAILCGILLWKELKGAPAVALGMLALVAILFAGGLAVLANPS